MPHERAKNLCHYSFSPKTVSFLRYHLLNQKLLWTPQPRWLLRCAGCADTRSVFSHRAFSAEPTQPPASLSGARSRGPRWDRTALGPHTHRADALSRRRPAQRGPSVAEPSRPGREPLTPGRAAAKLRQPRGAQRSARAGRGSRSHRTSRPVPAPNVGGWAPKPEPEPLPRVAPAARRRRRGGSGCHSPARPHRHRARGQTYLRTAAAPAPSFPPRERAQPRRGGRCRARSDMLSAPAARNLPPGGTGERGNRGAELDATKRTR